MGLVPWVLVCIGPAPPRRWPMLQQQLLALPFVEHWKFYALWTTWKSLLGLFGPVVHHAPAPPRFDVFLPDPPAVAVFLVSHAPEPALVLALVPPPRCAAAPCPPAECSFVASHLAFCTGGCKNLVDTRAAGRTYEWSVTYAYMRDTL